MKLRSRWNHGLGHLVLARQFGQRVAADAWWTLAPPVWMLASVQRDACSRKRVELALPSFRYCSSLPTLTLYSGGLRDVDVAALDQLGHLAVEEGEQQRADVRAVHVGVGHDDDAVVAQLGDVEVVRATFARRARAPALADAGTQRGDHREDFGLLVSSFS